VSLLAQWGVAGANHSGNYFCKPVVTSDHLTAAAELYQKLF